MLCFCCYLLLKSTAFQNKSENKDEMKERNRSRNLEERTIKSIRPHFFSFLFIFSFSISKVLQVSDVREIEKKPRKDCREARTCKRRLEPRRACGGPTELGTSHWRGGRRRHFLALCLHSLFTTLRDSFSAIEFTVLTATTPNKTIHKFCFLPLVKF